APIRETPPMPMNSQRKLSVEQAARLIYRGSAPSEAQIERVRTAIERGDLVGEAGATTVGAVAEFLARAAVTNRRAGASRSPGAATPPRSAAGYYGKQEELPSVYLDSLRNYFLSAISRKHLKQQSAAFQRGVLIGQIAFLVFAVAMLGYATRMIAPPRPPEQAAVLTWLEENTAHHRIIQWHPPHPTADGTGVRMRVQYHYATNRGKGIDTDRLFLIQQDRVVSVESDW
ncbi:MAG: hypothetical protein WD030_05215, partial [Pirellulales bacterium]